MKSFILCCCFFAPLLLSAQEAISVNATEQPMENTFYSLKGTTLDGSELTFESLRGKTILVINVASECGYTPQYADWQKFYDANKEHNVEVIGVPCNQFGKQEPAEGREIAAFCQKNYGVTFTMLEKADVKGENASPLYQWLTNPDLNGWNKDVPSWNFCKYLISPEGKLIAFLDSEVLPGSSAFIEALSKSN
jgi:glutathione peroxidase